MSLKAATKQENSRVELEIEVDAATFDAAVDRAYRRNIQNINVPGFRKGKAPRALVERMYGPEIFYEDAINDLYPEAMESAIKESGYEYVDDKVDLDIVSVGKDGLVFKAVITVKPEVEVGEYKGLKASKKVEEVTDEDINNELKRLQERNSRLVSVEDRPAENGDTVVLDFEGFVDDKPFEGGKAEGYSLVLGSGQFIPGFEDQIVGKKVDEEFEVKVTFPEDYHAEELAGKPAVFKCKLHDIKVKELPELNDDFAKDCSEFDTLEELKADIKANIEKRRQQDAEIAFENQLADQLADGLKADIPEAMFNNEVDQDVHDFEHRLAMQGLNLATYLQYTGMDEKALRDNFRPQAEKRVKVRLALEKISQLENIQATDEDVEAEYNRLAEQYHMDVDKVKAVVAPEALAKDLVVKKAMDLVKETAVAE